MSADDADFKDSRTLKQAIDRPTLLAQFVKASPEGRLKMFAVLMDCFDELAQGFEVAELALQLSNAARALKVCQCGGVVLPPRETAIK